jgi:hypothetical protein
MEHEQRRIVVKTALVVFEDGAGDESHDETEGQLIRDAPIDEHGQ